MKRILSTAAIILFAVGAWAQNPPSHAHLVLVRAGHHAKHHKAHRAPHHHHHRAA